MCGIIWTGMLMRRSEKTKPTGFELGDASAAGPMRVCNLECSVGSAEDFSRMYAVSALMDGRSCSRACGRVSSRLARKGKQTHLVHMEVQRCEEREGIALATVAFHGGADEGLGEDEVREVVHGENLRVRLKKLGDEALEREKVDVRVGVEELEVDVDEALLADPVSVRGGMGIWVGGKPTRSESDSSSEVSFPLSCCFLFAIGAIFSVVTRRRGVGRRMEDGREQWTD